MSAWYDRDGNLLCLMDVEDPEQKWLEEMQHVEELLKDREYKIVAQDYTPEGMFWISTVWLGLDHDFTWLNFKEPNPDPIIFESMVFSGDVKKRAPNRYWPNGFEYREDYKQVRYHTEKEAVLGHTKLMKYWTEREAALNDLKHNTNLFGEAAA